MNPAQYAGIAVALVTVGILGKRWGWFQLISGTNKLLREQNQELRNQNAFLKDEVRQITRKNEMDTKEWKAVHETNMKQLSEMKGQIDVLKSIPLVNIDTTLKQIAEFNQSLATSNEQVLKLLREKAEIDAEDRDVLTNQSKHIRDEVKKLTREEMAKAAQE